MDSTNASIVLLNVEMEGCGCRGVMHMQMPQVALGKLQLFVMKLLIVSTAAAVVVVVVNIARRVPSIVNCGVYVIKKDVMGFNEYI